MPKHPAPDFDDLDEALERVLGFLIWTNLVKPKVKPMGSPQIELASADSDGGGAKYGQSVTAEQLEALSSPTSLRDPKVWRERYESYQQYNKDMRDLSNDIQVNAADMQADKNDRMREQAQRSAPEKRGQRRAAL